MALKRRITKLEDVEEGVRHLYKLAADNNGFVLDLEHDPKTDEYRQNNVALNKRVAEMQAQLDQYDGIDVEEHKKMQTELDELKKRIKDGKKKGEDDDDFQARLERETESMRANHQQQIAALTTRATTAENENKTMYQQMSQMKIDTSITDAVNQTGASLKPGAKTDVLARAQRDWTVDKNGHLKPREGLIDAEGTTITTMDAYARNLMATAGYLFVEGGGGGAGGGSERDGIKTVDLSGRVSLDDIKAVASGKAKIK